MCGIAVTLSNSSNLRRTFASSSVRTLAHRGPDDEGFWEDAQVTMVHLRLSILDLSEAGHQPMVSKGGDYIMVYNGEIYNHLELRKQFLKDWTFKGHSDTETILALYERFGEGMLPHLVGMWAMAIWDVRQQRLFVSRDRYGQKPLFFARTNDAWMFSSEVKPLLEFLPSRTANATAVAEYLALGNYGHLGEHTFINEVRSFPPSHFAYIRSGEMDFERKSYWSIPRIHPSAKRQFGARESEHLRDLVVEAVRSQTLSDVPIGMTLSGGLDSSVIAGILSTHAHGSVAVFTARNSGNRYDESNYAKLVTDHWKQSGILNHHFVDMDKMSISRDLSRSIAIQGEPFGDPSIISHLLIMEQVRNQGIKVLLGGQGADELFFGYDSINQALLISALRSKGLKSFMKQSADLHLGRQAQLRLLLAGIAPAVSMALRRKSRGARRSFIHPRIVQQVQESWIHLSNPTNFYDVWTESIKGVHLPHLMHYDDHNAMHFGIEGRMPFLDHRIIEFLATIEESAFLAQGVRKSLLKSSCRGFLPPAILNRQDKVGFFAPIHEMIHREHQVVEDMLENFVFHREVVDEQILRNDLSKYKDTLAEDVTSARRLWRTVSLALWLNEFNISIA